jgi:hypothetical protein
VSHQFDDLAAVDHDAQTGAIGQNESGSHIQIGCMGP